MQIVEEKAWAGVDVGKGFHWAHVVDARGTELLSRRVQNDEADLLALIDEALSLAGEVAWAVDQPGGGAALLLALLWERGQGVCYVPGLSVDRLAAYAGLVPAAHDSGKRVGNHRKGRGGNKVLKRVFYQSAFSSMRAVPESRAFYDRKRAEGKRHTQAVIALARRRVNVLWAMLRDGTTFEPRSAA